MIDAALALETLLPSAVYGGSLTAGTEASYNAIVWEDARPKPAWSEIEAAAAQAALPTADDVRAEAQRRIMALAGARDADHLALLISNATREAIRLQEIKIAHLSAPESQPDWTGEQATRAAGLLAMDAAIENLRARSNAMEQNPPENYTDDSHWQGA